MLSVSGSSPVGQASRNSATACSSVPRSMWTSVSAESTAGRTSGSSAGSSQRRDGVGLGAADVAAPDPAGCAQAEGVGVEEHRARARPSSTPRFHNSIALLSLPESAVAIGGC